MTDPGVFISFEGIDGSGKSTQARRLAEGLRDRGVDIVLTREPGGSNGAEQIRSLLLKGDADRWSPEAELLLFTAARRDHLERVIWPAIAAGKIVICDRFADSTRAYQGVARSDLCAKVTAIHDLMIGCEPDLTLLIDIDPRTALARAGARTGRETRFEEMGLQLQTRLRQVFLDLARTASERFRIIDGMQPGDAVEGDVLDAVLDFSARQKASTPLARLGNGAG